MLNLAVQVSVNSTGYFLKKSKQNQKQQRHLTLWTNYFTCKKPWCLTCFQAQIKETEYKFCEDNCSVEHWIKKYSETHRKKQLFQPNFPHTRIDSLNSKRAQVFRPNSCKENFFFVGGLENQEGNIKKARRKRKDQTWRRLATKNKIAQTAGYNLPTYREKQSIEELLKKYGEFAYLTGKPLGRYYLSTLDLDLKKVEFPEKLIVKLEKQTDYLLNCLRVSYDKTKKGLHIDILTPEPLPNEIIYYQGWGKVWNVGSIQSQGKYVVGEDKDKEFIKNGKWYWKVKKTEEVKAKLAKFFFMLGGKQQGATEKVSNSPPSFKKNNQIIQPTKHAVQAKILSVKKTCLADFLKVFYWNEKVRKRGYFLLNTYQKPDVLPSLIVGSIRSIWLISGRKHDFFNRSP